MSTENPFAFAIAVTHPSLHRAHWLSGDSVTSTRIHAECWPTRELAEKAAVALRPANPESTFTVRRFSR